jgi:hypothetical protein
MKNWAWVIFGIHCVWGIAYLFLVGFRQTLGTYILDGFNFGIVVGAHYCHFQFFIDYIKQSFTFPQVLQFAGSVWQLIKVSIDIKSQDKSYDANFILSIISICVLIVGICSNIYVHRTTIYSYFTLG